MTKLKSIIPFIILFCILVVVYHTWIFHPQAILTYGDWNYVSSGLLKNFFSLPYIWSTNALGSPNITISNYPFTLAMGILAKFGFSFALIERFVFLFIAVIGAPVSSYFLVWYITKSKIGGLIGALIFSFNIYFIIISESVYTILVADALSPLALFFFIKSLQERKYYLSIFAGIVLSVISIYEFRILYVIICLLGIYTLFYFLTEQALEIKSILKTIYLSFIPLIILGAVNLYWVIALFKSNSLTNNVVFSRGLFGNDLLHITDAITLSLPWWTGAKPVVFTFHAMPLYFWILPIVAAGGLLLNYKNKKILFFGIIALLGIFLSKQVDTPFPNIYPWLFTYLPGFSAFREASKFNFIIAIGYSVLGGAFVTYILYSWNLKQIYAPFLKWGLISLIAVTILINTIPLITGSFGTMYVPRTEPHDYVIFSSFISSQPTFFRTLFVPQTSRWAYYDSLHPIVDLNEAINNEYINLDAFKLTNDDTNHREIELLQSPLGEEILNASNIKYVVIPVEDSANDDDFYASIPAEGPSYFMNALSNIPYLHRISIGTSQLAVFENTGFTSNSYFSLFSPKQYPGDWANIITKSVIDPTTHLIKRTPSLNLDTLNELYDWNQVKETCTPFLITTFFTANNPPENCESTQIPINPTANYTLTFNYQGTGGYIIYFDDDPDTEISNTFSSNTKRTYMTSIQENNNANATIIFFSTTTNTTITSLAYIEQPGNDEGYLLTKTQVSPQGRVSYTFINATKKEVTLTGVSGTVYLAMSEGFDPHWRIYIPSRSNASGINIYSPLANLQAIGQQFRYYDALNAWQINVAAYCKGTNVCTHNPDGTYSMHLIVEYTPERIVYAGILLSIVSGFIILIALIYTSIKRM